MGKIFRVEFLFVNNKHQALVSVYQKEDRPRYHIQLIDGYLKKVFSAEHIRFEGDGYKKLEWYKNLFTREIMNRMISAIDREINQRSGMMRFLFQGLRIE